MEATFSELVKKTEGVQPWRRVFHAANGTVLVLVLMVGVFQDRTVLVTLGVLLVILLLMDVFRLAIPEVNLLFFRSCAVIYLGLCCREGHLGTIQNLNLDPGLQGIEYPIFSGISHFVVSTKRAFSRRDDTLWFHTGSIQGSHHLVKIHDALWTPPSGMGSIDIERSLVIFIKTGLYSEDEFDEYR